MNKTVFAVIGGDLRQTAVANALADDGYVVRAFALEDGFPLSDKIIPCSSLYDAVLDSHAVVLPLPVSNDDRTINARNETISFSELFAYNRPLYIGGKLCENFYNVANEMNCQCIDYLNREELSILNAIPTSEGAIQIMMEELPITLHDSNCLVLGFGRIAKVLAHMLTGLGAHVSCCARKHSDLAWISTLGYRPMHILELPENVRDFDVILNTIPAQVLTREVLDKTKTDVLVIALASKPGGVDFEAARELNIKTIWALSLPGKVMR